MTDATPELVAHGPAFVFKDSWPPNAWNGRRTWWVRFVDAGRLPPAKFDDDDFPMDQDSDTE